MSNNWAKRQARDQQRAEAERQRKIKLGRSKIDKALDSTFTPDVFKQVQQSYVANYMPQLQKQYGDAKDQWLYQFARQGLTQSDAAARQFGELAKMRSDEAAAIASRGIDAGTQLRGRVEDTRSDLYGQVSMTADPAAAARSATAQAATLAAPPSYDPYQDVFARSTGMLGQAIAAERQGYGGTGTGYFRPRSTYGSRGSVSVIR